MTRRSIGRVLPAIAIAVGLAAAVIVTLRAMLSPGFDRLPGTDSGNLYSWELYTRDALASGRLPYWNPFQFGGVPHLADTQTTVLYPPALLLRWLPPLAYLPVMAAFHVWLAGIGALFLARVAGLGWLAAAAAAIAVTFGGSVTPWLRNGHLLLIYCAAWLPWALAFAILSVRRGRLLPHPGLVGVLVLQLLSGYAQGGVYLVAAVCLYFLYAVWWPEQSEDSRARRWRPLAQLAVVGGLATGIAAFQLLPTLQLIGQAARTSGLPYDTASRGGLTFTELASLFFPNRIASDRLVYVGWLLACMLPFAWLDHARRRLVVFFAVVAAAAFVIAFGNALPFYRLHYAVFPGFRIPGRVLFVATTCLAVIGAIGLQRLVDLCRTRDWRPLAVPSAVSIGMAAGAIAVALFGLSEDAPLTARWPWVAAGTAIGVLALVAAAPRVGSTVALMIALAIVASDVTTLPIGAMESIPVTPRQTVRTWLGPPDGGRVVSFCEHLVGPRELLDDRRPGFTGFGAINLRDQADWALLVPEADGPLALRRDLMDLSNVTEVVACRELDAPRLSLISRAGELFTYRNETAWPRALWTCGAQTVTRRQAFEQLRDIRYDDQRRLVTQRFVGIRWAAGVDDGTRHDRERRYALEAGVQREGLTWRYQLRDLSAGNTRRLLSDPAIEDTSGLDRQTGALVEGRDDDPKSSDGPELLIGAGPCAERGDVKLLVADQPDGRVEAEVTAPGDGVVFFSEAYYPERRAFVDGRRVTAAKANLAFVAVPVRAGTHRVELRYVPTTFYTGAAVSAGTLLAWVGAAAMGRARKAA